MKILEYVIRGFGIIAGILIIIALIAYIFEIQIFGVVHVVNYFHVANTCLLAAIGALLFLQYREKKLQKE